MALSFASSTISKYIPTLKEIARSSVTRKRKAAADLLVQCYILKSRLAAHLETPGASLRYARLADSLLELVENPSLAVKVARVQAYALDYAGQKKQALQAGLQAKYLLETNKGVSLSPQVASYIYAGLADYQAQNGEAQDALASLKKAHIAFFTSSEIVDVWVGTDHDQGILLIHDDLVHYYLGHHKQASNTFKQLSSLQNCGETCRNEALIDRVWAEVMREDNRDMELCISIWKQGIKGAIAMKSQAQYDDGMAAYNAMRAAWPAEIRIKELRDYAVHW